MQAERLTLSIEGQACPALSWGDGPLVLALHGFPDLPLTWRHQGPAFAEAGFRLVAPTLRGYAPTLRLPCARPAQAAGLAWLMKNRPPPGEITLVHGDFRTGNLLFEPEGLTGVLDWEFAHWGSPLEDLGWLCVRDWRFGALDRAVGGLCRRAPFVEAYTQRSGRAVSAQELTFWEVYGNLRWAAGAILQGQRVLVGPERDLELLAIPWRAAEMEYEALRLIAHHAQTSPSAP